MLAKAGEWGTDWPNGREGEGGYVESSLYLERQMIKPLGPPRSYSPQLLTLLQYLRKYEHTIERCNASVSMDTAVILLPNFHGLVIQENAISMDADV